MEMTNEQMAWAEEYNTLHDPNAEDGLTGLGASISRQTTSSDRLIARDKLRAARARERELAAPLFTVPLAPTR